MSVQNPEPPPLVVICLTYTAFIFPDRYGFVGVKTEAKLHQILLQGLFRIPSLTDALTGEKTEFL